MKTVVAAGARDTKEEDYKFLVESLRSNGVNALTVDFGVMGDPLFMPDVASAEVARASGVDLATFRQSKDKAFAMRARAEGLPRVFSRLLAEGRLDAVCGMDGFGSTATLSAAMRGLTIGVPKLLVSTVASGDVSGYIGSADVTLMHSVVERLAAEVAITEQTRSLKSLRSAHKWMPLEGSNRPSQSDADQN